MERLRRVWPRTHTRIRLQIDTRPSEGRDKNGKLVRSSLKEFVVILARNKTIGVHGNKPTKVPPSNQFEHFETSDRDSLLWPILKSGSEGIADTERTVPCALTKRGGQHGMAVWRSRST
jgi:hypothetical protein